VQIPAEDVATFRPTDLGKSILQRDSNELAIESPKATDTAVSTASTGAAVRLGRGSKIKTSRASQWKMASPCPHEIQPLANAKCFMIVFGPIRPMLRLSSSRWSGSYETQLSTLGHIPLLEQSFFRETAKAWTIRWKKRAVPGEAR
jgi:hypothetical protein